MYDASRIRVIARTGVSIVVSLFAINAILVLITAAFPDWLPRQFFGIDFLVDNRQRAQATAALYREGTLDDSDPLVVVLGLSSASEGVTLESLRRAANDSVRFVSLSGAGRNMRDLARYAEPLIDSDVQPAMAVFAINLFHFVDPPRPVAGIVANLSRASTAVDLAGLWLLRRRQDIKYAVDFSIDRARSAMFERFDVHLGDRVDPWREPVRMNLAQTNHDALWQDNIRRYGERGYYDVESFRGSSAQAEIFLNLAEAFADRGADILIVLMPEHSLLRERIPVSAMDSMTKPLNRRFGNDSPVVVDLRESVADSGFADISHLNSSGRKSFGPIFADAVARRAREAAQ